MEQNLIRTEKVAHLSKIELGFEKFRRLALEPQPYRGRAGKTERYFQSFGKGNIGNKEG